jgi:hypothetical protein
MLQCNEEMKRINMKYKKWLHLCIKYFLQNIISFNIFISNVGECLFKVNGMLQQGRGVITKGTGYV